MLLTVVLSAVLAAGAVAYMVWMPGESASPDLPAPSSEVKEVAELLEQHVYVLAEKIGPRSVHRSEALSDAAEYIERMFASYGYSPIRQPVPMPQGRPEVVNIEARLDASSASKKAIVIGAHYDSVAPTCPGANDNASGVAAVLTLSKLLATASPEISLRFVAFANEEPPYFRTEQMGSHVYARGLKEEGVDVIAMLSLETMGYFSSAPGSQRYPAPFSYFYPDRGNFIGFVGNLRSAALVRRLIKSFRKHAAFPSEGVAAPAFIPGIAWSDHSAFWNQGYPAVMVTDTAPFRYPHYHEDSDTWEKLDYESLARIVLGLQAVSGELAAVP
ncbi:MAG: M28 family peptidase [Bdellovibrionales bacterium]|nr:M28 family peptidase [Bdellovibrionales bacterium]